LPIATDCRASLPPSFGPCAASDNASLRFIKGFPPWGWFQLWLRLWDSVLSDAQSSAVRDLGRCLKFWFSWWMTLYKSAFREARRPSATLVCDWVLSEKTILTLFSSRHAVHGVDSPSFTLSCPCLPENVIFTPVLRSFLCFPPIMVRLRRSLSPPLRSFFSCSLSW